MGAESHRLREAVTEPSFRVAVLVFIIVTALVFPIVLGLGMTKGLNHDEHQHVAAGALVAREGLIPYRDFPYFHTPYLPFAYAAIFRTSDHLLTGARLLSILSASAILGMIGSLAYLLFYRNGKVFASLTCVAVVLLGLTTALFTDTSGRAWNHEPSLLLVLFAFAVHVAGMRTGRYVWFVISGVILGLAIGTRITYAPLMAPFGLAALLLPQPRDWKWTRMFSFGGGLFLGLAGLVGLFVAFPEQATFDNFGFAKANIVYRFSTGEPRTMTLPTKLRFFFKEIVRTDTALFIAGLLPLLVAFLVNRRSGRSVPFQLAFLLLLLPFLAIGAFAPSPAFDQYFYPLVPILLFIGLYSLAWIPAQNVWFRRVLICGVFAVFLSLAKGARAFHDYDDYFVKRKWEGTRLHARAQEIRHHVTNGKILTFAPVYPLEAGLSIYPALSTGPFAWRVAPYVDAAKAKRIGIVGASTLDEMLAAVSPAGVLVGFEKKEEKWFKAYGERTGARLKALEDDHELWVPARKP